MCWHARAVKHLASANEEWVASLSADCMYEHIDEDVLDHDAVSLISCNAGCKRDLVLSVCCNDKSWPRAVLGADHSGALFCRNPSCCTKPGIKYRCQHCKAVDAWISDIDFELDLLEQSANDPQCTSLLSALAAELEGISLRQHSTTQPRTMSQTCPISVDKIDPDVRHPVMQACAEGTLGECCTCEAQRTQHQ